MSKVYDVVTAQSPVELSKLVTERIKQKYVQFIGGVTMAVVSNSGYEHIEYAQAILIDSD